MTINKRKEKKKIIFWSSSVVTIFVFFLVAFFIANAQVTCPEGNWDNSTGVCIPTGTGLPEGGGGEDPVAYVINEVMLWLLRVVGFIAIIAFVVSGMQYLTAAGNESQIETAKRNTKWSIVGIIVALIGYIIIMFVDSMLSGTLTTTGGGVSGGGSGGSSSTSTSSGGTWVNPDTGQPFSDQSTQESIQRGENIVNSALDYTNNNVNSGDTSTSDTGLPIAQ